MSPEEWLGIVRWLSEQGVRWTADTVVKYGAALKRFPADKVRQACASLLSRKASIYPGAIVKEIRSRPSKFAGVLAKRHLELYPRGCPSPTCDVCLDANRRTV